MKSVGECEELEVTSANSDNTLSNTHQLTHEPLRAVGEVKDRYVLIDGKWYIERNCKEVVFDGSDDEEWYAQNTEYQLTLAWDKRIYLKNSGEGISDKLVVKKSSSTEEIYIYPILQGSTDYIRVANGVSRWSDKESFKQWLQQNPVTLIYPISQATYEPIDYNPLEVYSDVTHISTNSAVPTNITIKNHGFNCLLKPSTTYTISSNLGLNTVTTGADIGDSCLRFMDTDTSDVTTMKDVLILEGDWTTKANLIPANFSGIESAFEQEYDAEKGKYKVNVKVTNEDKTKENNITFYINEPLRGAGDAKDRVFIQEDKVVVQRNCASYTLDGSEDENIITCSNNYCSNKIITFMVNCECKSMWEGTEITIKSNTFNAVSGGNVIWGGKGEGITSDDFNQMFLSIKREKLQTQDVAGFKQFLQQNPVTIVYQLAEPTYEGVEYNDVKLFIESFKNSTLSYNSNVPVTSKLYYSYSVPIVDTVAQTASISDEQDVMIIDLATQVAVMEMMLM